MTSANVLDGTGEAAAEEMLALLAEQASLFARLETLASKQRALVSQEDTGPLLAVLGERQKLSSRLARIGTHLEPVRREWAHVRGRLNAAQRTAAERHLSQSRASLQRIMESDEQDARVLAARKQTVAQALRGTHDTSRAMRAYRAPSGRESALARLDEAS